VDVFEIGVPDIFQGSHRTGCGIGPVGEVGHAVFCVKRVNV
jgi:hypothetical protein